MSLLMILSGVSVIALLFVIIIKADIWIALFCVLFFLILSFIIIILKRQKDSDRRRIQHIAGLAKTIEAHINDTFEPIDIDQHTPREIIPLISSINDLLRYFEDRYKQERDFTANASHELRTPLAGIRLQTEIAMKSTLPEQREKALKNIIKAADRGTRLVEQLLILSRLTADKVELEMEAVNLGELAARTIAELSEQSESKNIMLKMDCRDDGYIASSEDSMSILMHNLVRNAIAYCPSGSLISLSVKRQKGTMILSVVDDGPGIPKESRDLVLQRFQKAERGSRVGTGLGLAIVKRIAELHGASLTLESGKHGQGLSVILIFEEYTP